MARIGAMELDRLKRDVDLAELVRASGVELSKRGQDLVGCCPFHDDTTPSLVVSVNKNLWHCLGACQLGGSVIDWVMKTKRVSFVHAVEQLRAGAAAVPGGPSVRVLPPPVSFDSDDQQLLDDVTTFYNRTLKESPEALAYLDKRGLRSAEVVDHFKLGFANRTLGLHLPLKAVNAGEAIRARLEKAGIIRESGHEHLNGSLIIPILDENGHTQGMYGRKITERLRPGTPLHLYLPGPHRGIFNVRALIPSTEIILCEALIDALTFWCAGFRNVTSAYGVSGFTDEMLEGFLKYGTQRVYIAYDRDDAGERAAETLSKRLMAEQIECFRIQFPLEMDANEYALKNGGEALGTLVRNAEWLGKRSPRMETAPVVETTPVLDAGRNVEKAALEEDARAEVAAGPDVTPAPPDPKPFFEVQGADLVHVFEDRRYRISGVEKSAGTMSMKVKLSVRRADCLHVDTLDLNVAPVRARFEKMAAVELSVDDKVVHGDVGRLLLELELFLDQSLGKGVKKAAPVMTDDARAAALELLRDKQLTRRILDDFDRCGVVGEEVNKLVGYIGAVSRKLPRPLAIMVMSTSAAGKSSLMEAVLAFVPDEEKQKYSAMTDRSLYYVGETELSHKIVALVEEEGAERASYPLKLLQSEGELTIASTGKDPQTGNLETRTYRVAGPVMIFVTTTSTRQDPELLNRCVLLSVNEDREQTRAIHRLQREKRTLDGLFASEERAAILELHQNAQRLLKPLHVVNRFARKLTFLDDKTRTRRDHDKYLTLIDAVALLRQFQKELKKETRNGRTVEYIEVELEDVAVANELAANVLGKTLDELPPQSRVFLTVLHKMVGDIAGLTETKVEDVRFSRRDIRELTGWTNDQIRVHLERLVEFEYVLVHRGGRGSSFVYELLYDGGGADGRRFLLGLIGVDALEPGASTRMTSSVGGTSVGFGGALGAHWGAIGVGLGVSGNSVSPRLDGEKSESVGVYAEKVNGTHPVPGPNHSHGTTA